MRSQSSKSIPGILVLEPRKRRQRRRGRPSQASKMEHDSGFLLDASDHSDILLGASAHSDFLLGASNDDGTAWTIELDDRCTLFNGDPLSDATTAALALSVRWKLSSGESNVDNLAVKTERTSTVKNNFKVT
jgi:hypothetical protein